MTYSGHLCVDCRGRIKLGRAKMGAVRCVSCHHNLMVRTLNDQRPEPARTFPRAEHRLAPKACRPSVTGAAFLGWLRSWAIEQRAFLWWLASARNQTWDDFYAMPGEAQERYREIARREMEEDQPRVRVDTTEFQGVGCA